MGKLSLGGGDFTVLGVISPAALLKWLCIMPMHLHAQFTNFKASWRSFFGCCKFALFVLESTHLGQNKNLGADSTLHPIQC